MGINKCSQPASKSSWDSQDFGDVNMVLKMVHFDKSSRPQWVNGTDDNLPIVVTDVSVHWVNGTGDNLPIVVTDVSVHELTVRTITCRLLSEILVFTGLIVWPVTSKGTERTADRDAYMTRDAMRCHNSSKPARGLRCFGSCKSYLPLYVHNFSAESKTCIYHFYRSSILMRHRYSWNPFL